MTERDSGYVAFVEEGWGRYLRPARLLTGDRHRAEELLQDSLVKLYVRWRRVSARGDPHAYLRRMLVTGNISRWRRARREQLTDVLPDRPAPGPDGAGQEDELWRALLELPARQRAVVVLRYYEDLTERETAAVLGCTIGTVKSQNARAMARLRAVLPAQEQTERTVRP